MPEESLPEDFATQAEAFRLFADPTRLALLSAMADAGPDGVNVTRLCEIVGQSQPAVSHHLALLRVSGAVQSRRSRQNNLYSITPGGRLAEAIEFLAAILKGAYAPAEAVA